MRPILTLLACIAAALIAAAPASADSLVYIKENNVWLSNPDGSGAYQVTRDGTADNPYISPSQADDGTIVAARHLPAGGPLFRMRQNGDLINEIPVGGMLAGPFAAQVSPDGQTVAFEHVFSRYVNGYLETSSDVRFTRTDGSTPAGLGEVGRGAGAPSWIDSTHAFVGINSIATTVVPGQNAVEWWSDYDHQPKWFSNGQTVEDGEVAPNGEIAVVRGEGPTGTIQLYRNNGIGALPTPTCTLASPSPGPAGEQFVDPTFSPDGSQLAWQEGNGIWMEEVDDECKGKPHLQIPGASEPDWGPAPVNPGPRSVTPPPPGPTPGTPSPQPSKPTKKDGGDGKGKGGEGARSLAASIAAPKLAKALAKGLTVKATAPGRGTLSAVAKLGAKPVASGSQKVTKAGATALALRFSPKARHTLAARRQVSLRVAVRFAPAAGGAPTTQTLAVKLAR
jgi:hypothetical protein